MNMHILSGGRLRYRRSIYYPSAGRDETIELPVVCVLLKHKQGVVLFDTGCHPDVATNAGARRGGLARLMPPIMTEADTVLAQAVEIAAATADRAAGQGYLAVEFGATALTAVDGERDLFGDGRITMLPLPGHTPGSMGLHVVLDRGGAFVLAAGAVAVRAHLDRRYAPKNTWNVDAALASIDRVAEFQRNGATVVFGHDDEQWQALRTGEAFYA
jgi:glyoxylase-like metal-dependent hydrolase (beta-lactamase superfamily II)